MQEGWIMRKRRSYFSCMLTLLFLLLSVVYGKSVAPLRITAMASQTSWVDHYIAIAQSSLDESSDAVFYLANLDDDDVPEMVISYSPESDREKLIFWYQDQVLGSPEYDYHSFSYIPGTCLLRYFTHTDRTYDDNLFEYKEGKFYIKASGKCEAMQNEPERDENGSLILNDQFTYTWNDQGTTTDAYASSVNSIFPASLAVSPYDVSFDLNSLTHALQDGTWKHMVPKSSKSELEAVLSGDNNTGVVPVVDTVSTVDTVDTVATEGTEAPPAPEPETRYEVVKAGVSWKEAKDQCIAKGGHLATISDITEERKLEDLCQEAGIRFCWIGGYTSELDGEIVGHWVTEEPFDFSVWNKGEPSGIDASDNTPEYYMMLQKGDNYWAWNDQRNDVLSTGIPDFIDALGYICEYE